MSKINGEKIDESKFLYKEIETLSDRGFLDLKDVYPYMEHNLSSRFDIRAYQKEAFRYFITYIEEQKLHKNKQIHLLFHMATGSGKTYMMAGIILYLYKQGYRDFLFFVNTTNIIEKTKTNFLNPDSLKFLFSRKIVIDGINVGIKEVNSFSESDKSSINIKFTTIQQLHLDLNKTKENSTSINDFEEKKIVLIADEAHHINSDTKKKLTQDEQLSKDSWEKTVDKIFRSNKDNVMLEFTATADLKNQNINEKYTDKLIYNYPLLKFRESGHTKDFYNLQSSLEPLKRVIQAMLLSQYRLKLFEKNGRIIKPTILLKSKTIDENKEFYNEFISYMQNAFSIDDIEIIKSQAEDVVAKMFNFFDDNDITSELLIEELKQAFSEDNLIIMDSKDTNVAQKQLLVNDLENPKNPYRMIFTVDMLNEGWDVLNLFDIVRLYETRQVVTKGISKTTIQEAQLIGRGVRYCPFKLEETDNAVKRKFDNDIENELRVCETLYYHSKEDSRYIQELREALKEIGFDPKSMVEFEYKVKNEFKNTPAYNSGKLFINKLRKKEKVNITGIPKNIIVDTEFDSSHSKIQTLSLYSVEQSSKTDTVTFTTTNKVFEIDKRIVLKAIRQFPMMQFNILKDYFPQLKSINEFSTSKDYAGKYELTLITNTENPTNIDYYKGLLKMFQKLSDEISNIKVEYEGTKEFIEVPLNKYVKDTKRQKSNPDNEGEGISQNSTTINKDYRLDLTDKDWYVYTDNFGTTEEKRFVKYFSTKIEELKKIYKDVYLIRNERNLHIYSFKDGARFEPDYILLLRRANSFGFEQQQIFVEPKGRHLRKNDAWKEEFMLEMAKEASTILYHTDGNEYKVIGLPFYTHDEELQTFKDAFDKLME